MTIEKTLVVLKPDSVQRGVVGEIISRFEKVGLKIVGMKMIHPDKEHYHTHYGENWEDDFKKRRNTFQLDA